MARNKGIHSRDVVRRYTAGVSIQDISKQLAITECCVLYHLKKEQCPIITGNNKNIIHIPKALEYYNSTDKIIFVNDVAKKFKISKKYLLKILKDRKLEIRDYRRTIIKDDSYYRVYVESDIILDLFKKYRSWKPIVEKYNLTKSTILSILKYKNIDPPKTKNEIQTENYLKLDVSLIIEDYKAGFTQTYIAKKYDISIYNVKKILKNNNIKLRDKISITKEQNRKDSHQRKAIKNSYRSKKYILPSGRIINVQGYEDDFLNYVFRNNILEEDDICFKPPRFKYSDRHYYPDFYIPSLNLIVEIKSRYTYEKADPRKEQVVRDSVYNYIIIIDKNYTEFERMINVT